LYDLEQDVNKQRHTTLLAVMLGVEDYGSDNDSDHEPSQNGATSSAQKAASPLKLPPPVKATSRVSPKPPKSKRAPKKITIGLPTLPDEPEEDIDVDKHPAKKPRLQSGAGSSSLLCMLPAPKQKQPVVPPRERVLGAGRGPGLVFEENSSTSVEPAESLAHVNSTLFRPTSLGKGRSNISIEEENPSPRKVIPKVIPAPPTDFFSLGSYVLHLSVFYFTTFY
jgi:proline-rich protein PRCC